MVDIKYDDNYQLILGMVVVGLGIPLYFYHKKKKIKNQELAGPP